MNSTAIKTSQAYKTWQGRLAAFQIGTPIPESLVTRIRHIFSNKEQGLADLLRKAEVLHPGKGIPGGISWRVTGDQTKKGLAWLQRGEIMKLMTKAQQNIVLNDFECFCFMGVMAVYTHPLTGHTDFAPVYRVCGDSGAWFEYISSPWQGTSTRFLVIDDNMEIERLAESYSGIRDQDGWETLELTVRHNLSEKKANSVLALLKKGV